MTLTDKTAVSAKWQTTLVKIDAESDILKALADGNDEIAIGWGQDAPNGTVEIKELVFFLYEWRAADYEKYAPIYYNSFYDFIPSNPLDSIKNEIKFDFSNRSTLSGMLMLKDTDATIVANKQTSTLVNEKIDGIEATKIDGLAEGASNIHRLPFWSGPAAKNAFAANESGTFYTAITYMTDGEGSLVLHHGGNGTEGVGAVTYCNTVPSDKWQTAVYSGTVGSKLMERLRDEYNIVALAWNNTEAGKNIYIKEIVFFTSKADAEKYGEDAARYYNYKAGYEKIDTPQTDAPTDPLSGINTSDYGVWDYASASALSASNAVMQSGSYTFTKDPAFGVRAIKPAHNGTSYSVNSKYSSGAMLSKHEIDLNYIAVTYMTPSTAQASITFTAYNGANSTVTADTSVSNGRWTTAYVKIEGNNKTLTSDRLNQPNHFFINWNNTKTGEDIYIREIVFFENEADVLTYAEKAPAYYNYAEDYSWNVDPTTLNFEGDKVIWSFTSESIGANGAQIMSGASIVNDPVFGYASAKVTATMFQCRYNATSKFTIANPRYVAITYMTPDASPYSLTFAYIGGSHTQSGKLSISNGRWVTEYVDLYAEALDQEKAEDALVSALKARLNKAPGGNHVIIQVFDGSTNITPANLYIRDIIFFEKEADVKAYAKQAPIYYNYYSK